MKRSQTFFMVKDLGSCMSSTCSPVLRRLQPQHESVADHVCNLQARP